MADLATVADVLARSRFRFACEDDLQAGIAAALTVAGITVEREVRLDGHSRIDLLTDRVGIEVKTAGRADAVLRQLRRYADSDRVDALILVTTRARHRVPGVLNGKPVAVVSLAGAAL